MSVNSSKRYYWLKLNQDFFDDDAMVWLEEQANGEKYELFYLKLCLKSLKNDGLVIRKVGKILMPYDVSGLAKLTHTEPDTVIVALELLKRIGLIEVQDSGALYLEQVAALTGSETNDARRKREYRGKIKAQAQIQKLSENMGHCPNNVPQMSGKNSARDRDRVRDRERVIETSQTSLSESKIPNEDIQAQVQEEFPKPTIEEVKSYVAENGLDKVDVSYFYAYWEASPDGFPQNWQQKAQSWQRNQRDSTEAGQEEVGRQDREVIAVGREVDENGVWKGYVDF